MLQRHGSALVAVHLALEGCVEQLQGPMLSHTLQVSNTQQQWDVLRKSRCSSSCPNTPSHGIISPPPTLHTFTSVFSSHTLCHTLTSLSTLYISPRTRLNDADQSRQHQDRRQRQQRRELLTLDKAPARHVNNPVCPEVASEGSLRAGSSPKHAPSQRRYNLRGTTIAR